MKVVEQIVKFFKWLDKHVFRLFYYTGAVVSAPIILLLKALGFRFRIVPREEDLEDIHTFRHFSASMVLTLFLYSICHFSITLAFITAFLVMQFYEIFDGFGLVDKRGYQVSDAGANFWGAFITFTLLL